MSTQPTVVDQSGSLAPRGLHLCLGSAGLRCLKWFSRIDRNVSPRAGMTRWPGHCSRAAGTVQSQGGRPACLRLDSSCVPSAASKEGSPGLEYTGLSRDRCFPSCTSSVKAV